MYWVLFLFSFFSLGTSFECPIPHGRILYPPMDFQTHKKFEIEWYYITGNLVLFNERQEPMTMGYQITTFINNKDNKEYSDFAISFPPYTSNIQDYYTVSDFGNTTFKSTVDTPFNLEFTSSQVNISYQSMSDKLGIVNSKYRFSVQSKEIDVDFYYLQNTPYLINGDDGYYGFSVYPECIGYYYWSLPSLLTEGTIKNHLTNKEYTVVGTSWFDHEYGSKGDNNSWIWFGLHLDIGNVMITLPRINEENLYSVSFVEIQRITGDVIKGKVLDFIILSEWKSYQTGIIYPSVVTLVTDILEISQLIIVPINLDQEIHNSMKKNYWEGNVNVKRNLEHNNIGSGYMI
jgi:predicted secreted hydrolase